MTVEGEFLSIPDRLVVSTVWGYFLPERILPGRLVEQGAQVGMVWDRTTYTPVVTSARGSFVRWLVSPWELVRAGVPVALLRADEGRGTAPGRGGGGPWKLPRL